jgi:hypothetical protein
MLTSRRLRLALFNDNQLLASTQSRLQSVGKPSICSMFDDDQLQKFLEAIVGDPLKPCSSSPSAPA